MSQHCPILWLVRIWCSYVSSKLGRWRKSSVTLEQKCNETSWLGLSKSSRIGYSTCRSYRADTLNVVKCNGCLIPEFVLKQSPQLLNLFVDTWVLHTASTRSRPAKMSETTFMMEPPEGQGRWDAESMATTQQAIGASLFILATIVYGLRIFTRLGLMNNALHLDDCELTNTAQWVFPTDTWN